MFFITVERLKLRSKSQNIMTKMWHLSQTLATSTSKYPPCPREPPSLVYLDNWIQGCRNLVTPNVSKMQHQHLIWPTMGHSVLQLSMELTNDFSHLVGPKQKFLGGALFVLGQLLNMLQLLFQLVNSFLPLVCLGVVYQLHNGTLPIFLQGLDLGVLHFQQGLKLLSYL